jgi:DNA-binding NarL/FixJ family response regulator
VDIEESHRGRVCCCHAEHFTETEIKVLCLLADGLSNSEIAGHLSVSGHTVDRHVTQMLRRSRTRNRAGLVSAAFRAGVLVVDSNMLRPSGRRCLLLADSAAPG